LHCCAKSRIALSAEDLSVVDFFLLFVTDCGKLETNQG